MHRLVFFLSWIFFVLAISFGCNQREKEAEPMPMPICSEEIPACAPTTDCTEEIVAISDLPAPLEAMWHNSKVGYLPSPTYPDPTTRMPFVKEAFVIRSRQDVEILLRMPDSPLLKLDFCQYTALVVEVYMPVGCKAITEQSLTKRCDRYIFTAKFESVGGCFGQSQAATVRYYVVVPRLSKCAEVAFDITP